MGNNLYSNLVNFYNVNDENFKEFMAELYKEMLTTHRDVQYVKEHLTEEIVKILDKYLVDGKFNVNIEEKVNEFLENNQEIKDINVELTTNTNNIKNISSQLEHKATQLKNINDLKRYNGELGENLTTFGYYDIGDGGGGKYVIVSEGEDDGGSIISLNNGLKAKLIHNGEINSKQYGVVGDGITDDTLQLERFFKNFGNVKLIVNSEIIRITSTVIIKGKWREDSIEKVDNSKRKLIFDKSVIKYDGEENGISVYIHSHYNSEIDGLSIMRKSVENSVVISGMWFSTFKNFDINNLGLFYNEIGGTQSTKSTMTNNFSNGIINGDITFDDSGTYINSIHFRNAVLYGNNKDYACIFKNCASYQNITFTCCDLSYYNKSCFYIEKETTGNSSISLKNVYMDTPLPYTEDFSYKGFNISAENTYEAANSNYTPLVYVKDFMKQLRLNNIGQSPYTLPLGAINLCKNGDLSYTDPLTKNWTQNGANRTLTFQEDCGSLGGNSMTIEFIDNANDVTTRFFSIDKVPFTGVYTVGIRCKKIQGDGRIQIGLMSKYKGYELSKIADGEEVIFYQTNNFAQGSGIINKGEQITMSLTNFKGATTNTKLEIYEIFMIPGVSYIFMTPMHPKAIIT